MTSEKGINKMKDIKTISNEFIDICVDFAKYYIGYNKDEDKNLEVLTFYVSIAYAIHNNQLFYDFEKDFEENFNIFLDIMKIKKLVASKNNVFGALCYSLIREEIFNNKFNIDQEIKLTYTRFNELINKYNSLIGVNKEKATNYFLLYVSLTSTIDMFYTVIGGGES